MNKRRLIFLAFTFIFTFALILPGMAKKKKGPTKIEPGTVKGEIAQIDPNYQKYGAAGWVDEEGFLSISGRKKNIFISTSGKNIYPQSIEKLLKLDPYIEQAIVFGEGRNYVTALIVPNFKALEEYAREMDIPFSSRSDLVTSEEIMGFMMLRVNASGRELAPYEKVKKIALLERDFSLEKGEVTPTGKLCRNVVAKKNKRLIESLYTS